MKWLLFILMTVLAGCARMPPEKPGADPAPAAPGGTNASPLIVTPSSVFTGTVSLVNANARYVVVSYPVGLLPEVGRRLNVYRDGLKVGEIRISGPHRDVNTVADILAGEARPGDDVRPD